MSFGLSYHIKMTLYDISRLFKDVSKGSDFYIFHVIYSLFRHAPHESHIKPLHNCCSFSYIFISCHMKCPIMSFGLSYHIKMTLYDIGRLFRDVSKGSDFFIFQSKTKKGD